MKISKYNLSTKLKSNEYILHNMLNKTTILLSKKEFANYNQMIGDDKFNETLKDLGFYVENDFDETQQALKLNSEACNDYSALNITIIPTFACNLNCKYCYQNGLECSILSNKNQNVFIEFVKKRLIKFKSETFHLAWFGGEPLLVFDIINNINTHLKEFCNNNNILFTSSVATNVTLLSEEMAKRLQELNVVRIETTLAGLRDEHNELRPTKSNEVDSYSKTIDGIITSSKYFTTMINVNFCKSNYKSIKLMLKKLKAISNKNIYINFNEIINYKQNRQQVNQYNDCEKIKYKLFVYALKLKLNVCDTTNFSTECMFCPQWHVNSFAVDDKLNLYKCTDRFDKQTTIGYINNDNYEILNEKDCVKTCKIQNECIKCKYLPYCYGGCEVKRNLNESPCPTELNSVYKYLSLFVKRKEDF